jgi:hypothetical protein
MRNELTSEHRAATMRLDTTFVLTWLPSVTMMLLTTLSYIDRNTLAILAPTILRDTGLSNEQYGFVISGFSIAYMLCNPLWGTNCGPRGRSGEHDRRSAFVDPGVGLARGRWRGSRVSGCADGIGPRRSSHVSRWRSGRCSDSSHSEADARRCACLQRRVAGGAPHADSRYATGGSLGLARGLLVDRSDGLAVALIVGRGLSPAGPSPARGRYDGGIERRAPME